MRYISTKVIPMGSTAFRQWKADSHCKLIHGYRLQTKIYFTADSLDDKNWVFDFGGCREIKKVLEKQFDHTTCVAGDDPELETFKLLSEKGMIDLRIMEEGVGIEKTAEWVYNAVSNYVKESTNDRVTVTKVEVWEHEGNSAIYEQTLNDNTSTLTPKVENTQKETEQKTKEEVVNNIQKEKEQVEGRPSAIGANTRVTQGMSNPFQGTSWG
tara:strand:- start:381 stop:1016 length:636 start_codon:yes stop_codon:yes gene_type:complete